MYIYFLGNSCFKIQTQDKETTLLLDPFDGTTGTLSKQTADVILCSSDRSDHGYSDIVKRVSEQSPFIINNPGEYDVRGVSIQGVAVKQEVNDKKSKSEYVSLFSIGIEGVFVGHIGALNRSLKEAELEALGRIDVLLLPVGGGHVLSPKLSVDVMSQLEPRLVIPCHYAMKEIKLELGTLEAFFKESGMKAEPTESKIKITKKDLPVEDVKCIVLNIA
ncbi:MAG: MBL fold metallo-hydrolase [bacterium]|nr:MBL fold metallo-hydrolase [bacterium]